MLCNTLLVRACAESASLSARSDINKHVLLCHRYSFFVNRNHNTVISKLDVRWGFHQIELEQGSRDITGFATDDVRDFKVEENPFWFKCST